jgi:hypothetical protein
MITSIVTILVTAITPVIVKAIEKSLDLDKPPKKRKKSGDNK